MLVSIIIPTYNRLELLKRAIASVEAQSYTDYELIIIDDASTDGTNEYLLELDHITVTLFENKGVSYARNKGVALASGEYIAFLDSDDTWENKKLENQVRFHKDNRSVRCSFGIERWFRYNQEVKRPYKYIASTKVNFEDLLEFTFIGPSSVMIEKRLFSELQGFDIDLEVCEDFDLWLRITKLTAMFLADNVYIHKHAGDYEQLSNSVLSLEPYRVKALSKYQDNRSVKEVIDKKLEIIYKGAIKHDNQKLLEFCQNYIS